MATRALPLMTTDVFLHAYEGTEGNWELYDGVPVMMAGGSMRHAQIAGNLYFALRLKLRGSGCVPFNSDAGLSIDAYNMRYPDITVYCDRRDLDSDLMQVRMGRYPTAVFEVLSPGTEKTDRGRKLGDYQRLASLRAVALIDPVSRTSVLFERAASDAGWRERDVAAGEDIALACFGVTITADELFADG